MAEQDAKKALDHALASFSEYKLHEGPNLLNATRVDLRESAARRMRVCHTHLGRANFEAQVAEMMRNDNVQVCDLSGPVHQKVIQAYNKCMNEARKKLVKNAPVEF